MSVFTISICVAESTWEVRGKKGRPDLPVLPVATMKIPLKSPSSLCHGDSTAGITRHWDYCQVLVFRIQLFIASYTHMECWKHIQTPLSSLVPLTFYKPSSSFHFYSSIPSCSHILFFVCKSHSGSHSSCVFLMTSTMQYPGRQPRFICLLLILCLCSLLPAFLSCFLGLEVGNKYDHWGLVITQQPFISSDLWIKFCLPPKEASLAKADASTTIKTNINLQNLVW